MDDKGTTMIVLWNGLGKQSQEAAARAVCTAKKMQLELAKMDTSISIGIATGQVFAGVVGATGGRREFSILGDGVNLSARLMQAACKSDKSKIFIDELTAVSASNRVGTVFNAKLSVKGKKDPVNSYNPVDDVKKYNDLVAKRLSQDDFRYLMIQVQSSLDDILIHRMCSDIEAGLKLRQAMGKLSPKESPRGRIPTLHWAKISSHQQQVATLEEFIKNSKEVTQQISTVVIISGPRGSGKSSLLRLTLEKVRENPDIPYYLIYSSIEPNHYYETFDGLTSLYFKLMQVARITRKSFNQADEEIIKQLVSDNSFMVSDAKRV